MYMDDTQDGTLTVPVIDFEEMRRRVGIAEGDILDVIHSWDPARQDQAFKIIAEMEEQALNNMRIMPGAEHLCKLLDDAGIPRALVTRNVSSSVEFFHKTAFNLPPFFPSLSREWTPYKPDPAALHHIADQWGVSPKELVMIGDSAKDDIVCGNRAGAISVLLDVQWQYKGLEDPCLEGERRPDFLVNSLDEVASVLHEQLDLVAPPKPDAYAG